MLKHQIPLKTDRWDVQVPGFTEIDLVAHSGDRADGDFLHSLNVTDIHTTWVETRAVMGKSQHHVQDALEHLRQALPFRLRGIDSDNGSEFINHHLRRYCTTHDIQWNLARVPAPPRVFTLRPELFRAAAPFTQTTLFTHAGHGVIHKLCVAKACAVVMDPCHAGISWFFSRCALGCSVSRT